MTTVVCLRVKLVNTVHYLPELAACIYSELKSIMLQVS